MAPATSGELKQDMVRRVIARLDIKGENVVRGVHLEGLRVVGRPEEMAARYAEAGIDELVFIDTVASLYGRNKTISVVERTAARAFIPLTAGGGLRSVEDVREMLAAGADKVTINSAAVRDPALVTELSQRFGSQCVVAAIDAKRVGPGRWTVLIENGREATGLEVVSWAHEVSRRGAGEILLTSIDQDGMRVGFDLELTRAVVNAVTVPVIASGGPGRPEHVAEVFKESGAAAAAIGTMLHFGLSSVGEVKCALEQMGIETRPAGSD